MSTDRDVVNIATLAEQRQEARAVVIATDAASLMSVISRAASDPSTDVAKLERLLGMYERVTANTAKAAYAKALAAMQPELPVIVERGGIKDRNGKVQSTYALWEDLNDAIRPALSKHGFSLSFRTGYEGDKIVVTGVLLHRDGHSEETTMHLPLDMSGSKNAVQGVGSSTSYGKRYTASALLNLTSRGLDDDGHAAGAHVVTEEQADRITKVALEVRADITRFLNFFKAESISNLLAKDYDRAMQMLEAKRAKS